MSENVTAKENKIYFGENSVTLPYPIKCVEKLHDIVVVLLKIPTRIELGEEELHNVWGFSNKGRQLWKIGDEFPNTISNSTKVPYVSIQIQNQGLKAIDFLGRKFDVDIRTGKLLGFHIVR